MLGYQEVEEPAECGRDTAYSSPELHRRNLTGIQEWDPNEAQGVDDVVEVSVDLG